MLILTGASCLAAQTEEKKEKDAEENIVVLEKFVTSDDKDPKGLIPRSSESVFGLAKPILETPRSISVVGSEMIDKYAINELVDLGKFAPSTYTAFSFGIQGAVDVRGDGADVYYRGMKRITNGSNMPTVIGASDGVSVVRGPPSAVNGSGRVGGYMDYLPKSARASTGRYMAENTGKVTSTFGSYGKKQVSVEEGGPLKIFGKRAGYYVYSSVEDSKSYYIGSFTKQQIFQGTMTVDLTDALRLESGVNYQNFNGTGLAGWNRITQDLIDNRNYITGVPLNNLDTNNDGLLSRNEILAAGDLNKNIAFTGARPALPKGYALDPATVHVVKLDPRQILIERDGHGRDFIGFADLVNDKDSSLVFRSKFFAEYQLHHKLSDIAYFRAHEATLMEEKLTAEWTPRQLPSWFKFSALGALNVRYLDTYNITSSDQQIFSRWDLTRLTDGHYGITNGWDTPDDAGIQSATKSQHTESGAGLILDATFWEKTNLMVAGRLDSVYARVGAPATNVRPAADWAEGSDKAYSLSSVSLSHEIFKGVRPYITYSHPRTIIPGSSGGLTIALVRGQILQPSELKEAGVKASLFDNRLYLAVSTFNQYRSAYNATLDQYQNTRSDGTDLEIRWVPSAHFNLSAAADWKRSLTDPITAVASTQVTPAWAGYDPIAAYGGRITVTLPADPKYARRYSPDKVFSLFGNFSVGKHWDFSVGSNYQAGFPLSALQDIFLPSALTFSGSFGYTAKTWELRVSGKNLTDQLYFQPSGFGSTIAIPAVGRTWDAKYTRKF
ncbi:MAG TPA: TonB-dependent receptor [Opitutaceae bacterium]|nr:TonB-dependent receptor [Opitutaceae bacterium]